MKKISIIVLSVAMLMMNIGIFAVHAEEGIEISVYKANPGYSVNVSVNGENLTEETGSSVTWYVSDTEDGEYTQVPGAAGANWQIFNSCANKYIKACINGTYSNAIKVGDKASNEAYTQNSPIGMPGEVDGANVFKLADNDIGSDLEYILLDTEEYEGENLVLVKKEAVRSGFSTAETTLKFNPDTPDNLGYYLNHELLLKDTTAEMDKTTIDIGTSYYQALPKNIRNYINTKHIWLTEAGNGSVPNDYTFEAGITMMSRTELMKYKDKLGVDLLGQKTLLRTPMPNANRLISFGSGSWSSKADKLTWITPVLKNNPYQIFPEFYLTDDFFTNVKLDLENTGDNVKKMLHSSFTAAQLSNTYTIEELKNIGFTSETEGDAPGVADIRISIQKPKPGYTAEVSYQYVSEMPEGKTQIRWQVADAEDGTYTDVAASNEKNWTVTNACGGKYLRAKVVPMDSAGKFPVLIEYVSGAMKLDTALGIQQAITEPVTSVEDASAYQFKFNGEAYQMLDAEKNANGDASFFIYQAGHAIMGAFSSDENSLYFETTKENNIGYWLNNELLKKNTPETETYDIVQNTAYPISQEIRNDIDTNHVWLSETPTADGNDYTFTAGITLISMSEYKQYADRIGLNTSPAISQGATRTTYMTSNGSRVGMIQATAAISNYHINDKNMRLHAVFYLNENFFVNNYVAPTDMGAEVRKFIVQNISYSAMKNGHCYTEAELSEIGYTPTGYADEVVIVGKVAVGQRVEARYIFNNNGLNIAEDTSGTKYQWYCADRVDGVYAKIDNATEKSYTVMESDFGKYLRVEVTPIDGEGHICETGKATVGPISERLPLTLAYVEHSITENSAKVNFACINQTSAETVTVIIAVYEQNGDFVTASVNRQPAPQNGVVSAEINGVVTNGRVIKAMVWDSIDGMVPLCLDEVIQ